MWIAPLNSPHAGDASRASSFEGLTHAGGSCDTAKRGEPRQALKAYAMKRTYDGKGVTIPSQIRHTDVAVQDSANLRLVFDGNVEPTRTMLVQQ